MLGGRAPASSVAELLHAIADHAGGSRAGATCSSRNSRRWTRNLAYPDATFDCVVGQFVITLVEDAERGLSECARVLKPGGQIILVNHLYSEKGPAAAVDKTVVIGSCAFAGDDSHN